MGPVNDVLREVFIFVSRQLCLCLTTVEPDVIIAQINGALGATVLSSIKHTQLLYHNSGSHIISARRLLPDFSINGRVIYYCLTPQIDSCSFSAFHLTSGQVLF